MAETNTHQHEFQSQQYSLGLLQDIFDSLFHAPHIGIAIIDGKKNVLLEVNGTFSTITGLPRNDIINHPVPVLAEKYLKPESILSLQTYFSLLQAGGDPPPCQLEYNTRLFEVTMVQNPVQPAVCIAIVKHITQKPLPGNHGILAGQERDGKIDTVFEGMFLAMPDGKYGEVNAAFARMLGYDSPSDLVNSLSEIDTHLFLDANAHDKISDLLTANGSAIGLETQLRKKNGDALWVQINAVSVKNAHGRIEHFRGGMVDISERKQLEAIQRIQQKCMNDLNACTNLRQGLQIVLHSALRFGCVDCGGIYLADQNDHSLVLMIHQGLSHDFIEHVACLKVDSWQVQLARTGKVLYGECASIAPQMDAIGEKEGLRGIIIIPIMVNDRLIAVLNLASHRHTNIPTLICNALETLASQTGSTLLRLRSDSELRESEEKYRTLVDNINEAIVVIQDGALNFSNRQALVKIGLPEQELKSKPFLEYVFCEDRAMVEEHHRKQTAGESVPTKQTFRVLSSDGSIVWVEMGSTLIQWKGKPAILAYLTDITEQKKVEKKLIEHQERFQQFADTVSEGFWIVDLPEHRFIYANKAYEEFFDRPVIGKTIFEIYDAIHPDDRAMVVDARAAGKNTELRYRIIKKDGAIRWMLSRGFAPCEQSMPSNRLLGITTDITEYIIALEETERQRQQLVQIDKMASLGILVAGVAHEINNPNNFIAMSAPILREAWKSLVPIMDSYQEKSGQQLLIGNIEYGAFKNNLERLLQGIEEGSGKISKIVENLKDYARQDAFEFRNNVDLNKVVDSAVTLIKSMIFKRTSAFTMLLPGNPVFVNGNHQRLEQVVVNLLQNACDSLTSFEQAIIVEVRTTDDKKALIIVRDHGCGIPSEHIGRLTDPFFTTKRNQGGTGLGLSVSAGIIKDHKGEMSFRSVPGKGTSVTIELPMQ